MADDALELAGCDSVVSALTGNGELCTTLGPNGFHTQPTSQADTAHLTQRFALAGRRGEGPQHPLIDFGSVWCEITIDGRAVESTAWRQRIHPRRGVVDSQGIHDGVVASVESFVALDGNRFHAVTTFTNHAISPRLVRVVIGFEFGDASIELRGAVRDRSTPDGAGGELLRIPYRCGEILGDLWVDFHTARPFTLDETRRGFSAVLDCTLGPGESFDTGVAVQFSDRESFEFPMERMSPAAAVGRQECAWPSFWEQSEIVTGSAAVDRFREMSLYTLRCQATPWSIPPALAEVYWGAGAFHDELYPMLALLGANHSELASRICYFRRATLARAVERARGRGALYPWSSTERGEERDPNGPWLTERFHLGQIAVGIWSLWLYTRDLAHLDDLYPILREICRHFELNLLVEEAGGGLGTRACVDFDESVGPIANGPFTLGAAAASLEIAAKAAALLRRDSLHQARWLDAASSLRDRLRIVEGGDSGGVWAIPGGKPLHSSVLGRVFPFQTETDTPAALANARRIHSVCRSSRGWKPGLASVYEDTSWIWTGGHLAIVHAMQGDGGLAWDALVHSVDAAGPMGSPNEHVDRNGVAHVPWFTTGCGAWLHGLQSLFVQVQEAGAILLPALPPGDGVYRFRGLLGSHGVTVSGLVSGGEVDSLSVRAPRALEWKFAVPRAIAPRMSETLLSVGHSNCHDWFQADLPAGEEVSLLD